MEFTKIKRHGCEVNVIFTGEQYIFQNDFYGLLAVADRKGYGTDEETNTFTVHYGSESTLGGSFAGDCCLTIAKQFIVQTENRYIKRDITFKVVKEDINALYYMDFKVLRR